MTCHAQKLEAFLQHGKAGGPYLTERVAVKEKEAPRFYSASGYGSRIPTDYMVWCNGRWRRVYCVCWANVGSLYIGRGSSKIFVTIDRAGL